MAMNITANGILYKVEIQIKPTGSTHNTFAHLYRCRDGNFKQRKELIAGTSFNDKTAAIDIPIWAQKVVSKIKAKGWTAQIPVQP